MNYKQEQRKYFPPQTGCTSFLGTKHKEATTPWAGPLVYPKGDPSKVPQLLERGAPGGWRNVADCVFLMAYISHCNPSYTSHLKHNVIISSKS